MAYTINTNRTSGSGTVKEGVWQLVIEDSKESVSKSGNDMIVLTLAVLRNGRASGQLKDYLVLNEESQWKFDQLHDALDIEEGKKITCGVYKGRKLYAYLINDIYNGTVSSKIKTYLVRDVALEMLEQQGPSPEISDEDVDESIPIPQETRKPVSTGAKRGRPSQAVAEMESDDEEMPF